MTAYGECKLQLFTPFCSCQENTCWKPGNCARFLCITAWLFPLQELYIIDSAGKQTLVEASEKMVRTLFWMNEGEEQAWTMSWNLDPLLSSGVTLPCCAWFLTSPMSSLLPTAASGWRECVLTFRVTRFPVISSKTLNMWGLMCL